MQLCATVCNYLQLYATVNGKNIWYNIIVDLRVHPTIDIGYKKDVPSGASYLYPNSEEIPKIRKEGVNHGKADAETSPFL